MNDPFPQLRALQERIRTLADDLGLELVSLEFVAHGGYGNIVHFIVNVKQDTLKSSQEVQQDATNAEFDALTGGLDVTVDEDGEVTLGDAEPEEEPEDEALIAAEANIQERARERARRALEESKDDE